MAIGWFIVPYKRKTGERPTRYCAMDDYSALIAADEGGWAESEVLGNRAIVKVKASPATLATLNNVAGFKRLPKDSLDDNLSDLSANVRRAIRDELLDAGYAFDEVRARFGDDLGGYSLRDILRFLATRRKKPRYNSTTDTIIFDGPEQPCRAVEELDRRVS